MNGAESQEIKHHLLASHDQYRELAHLHHSLDDRLHELTAKYYLTEPEQVEEVTLKKRKLALKDQMERIAIDWAREHSYSS
jgi:uncharacterized protein YdcH (DUF465 family)